MTDRQFLIILGGLNLIGIYTAPNEWSYYIHSKIGIFWVLIMPYILFKKY